MAAGVVKWFDGAKGFGFIAPDGGDKDIFVHHTEIVGSGFKTLEQGERVEFEVADQAKGPRAHKVVRTSPPTARSNGGAGENLGTLLSTALGKRGDANKRGLRGGLD